MTKKVYSLIKCLILQTIILKLSAMDIVKHYRKIDFYMGWVIFAIALLTYVLTLEPTVSFWDCGEYISTSAKLEVGHPPGAPLFQMLGAFFSMFALSADKIAYMINFMSAFASAFTILFLFWTITHLANKIALQAGKMNVSKALAILGSGVVGALAYTFSDSFWFSAVEGEVYAMSSFLMALLFWLALKWEQNMDKPRGHRWLLLISYIIGLSFGVHILALLVIPAMVFICIYKNHKAELNPKQFILYNILAILILAFVFKFLFPFTLRFFAISELFFVNNVGLPFNSGSIIAFLVLIAAFYYGLKITQKRKLFWANTIVLCILFVVIGFSSWLMLPIRSNANTTINENSPKSARELLAYYNREQYGDANVFYDTYYSVTFEGQRDKNRPYKDGKPKYEKDEKIGKYVIVNDYKDAIPNYSSKHKGFIPRMTSSAHIRNYKNIANIDPKSKERPTFLQNIFFMLDYQFGYMYMRYFLWNFVGRQNDIQGRLDIENGNWLSGINWLDELRLGPQTNLPKQMANNKGRNLYYFLPLLLGLVGLFYQVKRDIRSFYPLLLFFVFTGFAIIFYTNPKPFEPRERDYAVVGSFYIFALWIGFGVYALYDYANKYLKQKRHSSFLAISITVICLLLVPVLMACQNWDDHDRSGKYTALFNAKTYLDSCDKNAIMFTIGDNDTFPLWYLQEVENYRTDIKLVNTSLLATDWYIDQVKRKTYQAPPIPSQLVHKQYRHGTLDIAYCVPQTEARWHLKNFMKWIASDDRRTYIELQKGKNEKYYPTYKLRLPVDKRAVLQSGLVKEKDSALIVSHIDIDIDKQGLTKNRIMMLDILANNHWKQPIYFTGGASANEEYIWLKDYLQLDGMSYKFVPIKTSQKGKTIFDLGRIDSELMYENIKKWKWEQIADKDIYMDIETRKNTISYRNNLMRLAEQFIIEKQSEKAVELLDKSLQYMPFERFGNYGICLGYINLYYDANASKKAKKAAQYLMNIFKERLKYYSRFPSVYFNLIFDELERNINMYKSVVDTLEKYEEDKKYITKVKKEFIEQIKLFEHLLAK